MLNCFTGIGRLEEDAAIMLVKGETRSWFTIGIPALRRQRDGNETDTVACLLLGDKARLLTPYLKEGVMVGVRGRLVNGEEGLIVSVNEVNFLQRKERD